MFMRKGSKILAWALAFVMVISLAAVPVSAEGPESQADDSVASVTIGETTTYYDTISEAVAAINSATEASTLTILEEDDTEIAFDNGQSVTLDLQVAWNGTITVSSGTLDISNGTLNAPVYVTGTGSLNVSGSACLTGGIQLIDGAGSINISGGILTNTNSDAAVIQVGLENLDSDYVTGSLTISGGTFTAKDSTDIFDIDEALSDFSVEITGGTYNYDITEKPEVLGNFTFDSENYTVTDNGGGTYTVTEITAAVDGVAKNLSTETEYETLQAAINAASSGNQIQLLQSLTEDITVDYDRNVIIDLAGYTLTGDVSITGGTLTVEDSGSNGIIVGDVTVDAATITEDSYILNDGSCVPISSYNGDGSDIYIDYFFSSTNGIKCDGNGSLYTGSFTLTGGIVEGGVTVSNNSSFTMNGGTITGNSKSENGGGVLLSDGNISSYPRYAVTIDENGNVTSVNAYDDDIPNTFTMNGGTISNCNASNYGGGVYIGTASILNLNGGVITDNTAATGGGVYVACEGILNFYSGDIYGNTATTQAADIYLASLAYYTGITNASDMITAGYTWYKDASSQRYADDNPTDTITLTSGDYVDTNTSIIAAQGETSDVASVTVGEETTYFVTFAGAVEYANSAGTATITLLDNITLTSGVCITGTDITLDVGTYTLSGEISGSKLIEVEGSLTVKGSGGSVKNTATDTGSICISNIVGSGTTIVEEGVTISGLTAITGESGCTVKVNGGTVSGTYAAIGTDSSTIIISGGTVSGDTYAIYIQTSTKLDITGGTITSDGIGICSDTSYVTIGSDGATSNDQPVIRTAGNCIVANTHDNADAARSVVIYSGTLTVTSSNVSAITLSSGYAGLIIEDCIVSCSNGTSSATAIIRANSEKNTISISGGHFFSAVDDDYCATGYTPYTEVDGTDWYTNGYPYTVEGGYILGVSSQDGTKIAGEIIDGEGSSTIYVKVASEDVGVYSKNVYPTTSLTYTPTSSADSGNYIFAGWYSYDGMNFTALNEILSGTAAYAKFVDANVLSVAVQLPTSTKVDSTTTSMRLITTVDTLKYSSVGFVFTVGSNSRTISSDKVYEMITATEGGTTLEIQPTEFSSVSSYFATCTVTNIPCTGFGTTITIQATWTTLDGTVVYGEAYTCTVNGLLSESGS